MQLQRLDHIEIDFGQRLVSTSCHSRWVQPFKITRTAILSHRVETIYIIPSDGILCKQPTDIAIDTARNFGAIWKLSLKIATELETSIDLLFVSDSGIYDIANC